jgi:hypothetical protein
VPQPLENSAPNVRLLKRDSILPPTVETALRRFLVDKLTGNLQLNIKDGKILGFHETRMSSVPTTEF